MSKGLVEHTTINKELGDTLSHALTEDNMFDEGGVLMPVRLIKHGEKYEYAIDYFGERRDDWGLVETTWDAVVGHTLREVLDKYNEKTGRPISHVKGFKE